MMFTIEPILAPAIVLPVAIALWILLSWLEWRKSARFRTVRLIACFVMASSLLAIVLRPGIQRQVQDGSLLITDNYNPLLLDSLREHFTAQQLISSPTIMDRKFRRLSSWNELADVNVSVIIGSGVPASGRELLQGKQFDFISSAPDDGIVSLSFPRKANVYQPLVIQGSIATATPAKLLLQGMGTVLDSVTINKGKSNFTFRFRPKAKGQLTYVITDERNIRELVPIEIVAPPSLNILLLQHYPTFESRQLKTFLGKQHRLAVRYQLSKGVFRDEAINRNAVSIRSLTTSLLKDFDLMIIDSDEWLSLSSREVAALEEAIHNGLGMLLLLNEDPSSNQRLSTFFPGRLNRATRDTAHVILEGKMFTIERWPVAVALDPAATPLLGSPGNAVAGYQNLAFGKKGFQLLTNTYSLPLKGDSSAYQTLWSDIIGGIAKSQHENFKVEIVSPQPNIENEPIEFRILSAGEMPEATFKGRRIPLEEDFWIDDIWYGKVWAEDVGWNELVIQNDSSRFSFFVHRDTAGGIIDRSRMDATLALSTRKGDTVVQQRHEPVSEWIFFIGFLFSAGLLWILPKL